MDYTGDFDFFYGKESERYHFIIVPKLFLTEERFQGMSAEAKLLYGCLLDRNSLSQKNGWVDEQNRVYVLYTVQNMMKDLGCASEKVNKVLRELEEAGLIYRRHNGVGKANYIYVMDYMAFYRKEYPCIRKSKSPYSKNESDGVRKSKSNKTDNNKTDFNKICSKSNGEKHSKNGGRRNKFCEFPQREYDFKSFEQLCLTNLIGSNLQAEPENNEKS